MKVIQQIIDFLLLKGELTGEQVEQFRKMGFYSDIYDFVEREPESDPEMGEPAPMIGDDEQERWDIARLREKYARARERQRARTKRGKRLAETRKRAA